MCERKNDSTGVKGRTTKYPSSLTQLRGTLKLVVIEYSTNSAPGTRGKKIIFNRAHIENSYKNSNLPRTVSIKTCFMKNRTLQDQSMKSKQYIIKHTVENFKKKI